MTDRNTWLEEVKEERIHLQRLCDQLQEVEDASWTEQARVDAEVNAIADQLSTLQDRINVLQITRDRLFRQQDDLRLERTTRLKAIDKAKGRLRELSYAYLRIQDLPSDILRTIFHLAIEFDAEFCWTISAVCRDWRALVIETSSFWSRLHVQLLHPSLQRLRKTSHQLALSRNCPLFVTLDFNSCDPNVAVGHDGWPQAEDPSWSISGLPCDYVDETAAHLHRSERMLWDARTTRPTSPPGAAYWAAILLARRIKISGLTTLRRLHIAQQPYGPFATWQPRKDQESPLNMLVEAAPNLTQLSLMGCAWPQIGNTQSLKTLNIVNCSVDMDLLLSALAAQPHLVYLKIARLFCTSKRKGGKALSRRASRSGSSTHDAQGPSPSTAPLITLHSLQYLFYEQTDTPYQSSPCLLNRLACPELRRAVIAEAPSVHSMEAENLANFFARTPLLRDLAFNLPQYDSLHIVLQSLTSLRSLLFPIIEQPSWEAFPSGVCTALSTNGALPELRHLSLQMTLDESELVKMLDARIASGRRTLRSISCSVERSSLDPERESGTPSTFEERLRHLGVQRVVETGWSDEELQWSKGQLDM